MTDSRKIASETVHSLNSGKGHLNISCLWDMIPLLARFMVVLGLFSFGSPPGPAYGDDFRSTALRGVHLLLWQPTGQFTHFSATGNPAALFEDWHRNRVDIASGYQSETGDLHRLYDPAAQDNLHFRVDSWQNISAHQILYGGIHYSWLRLHQVSYALEPTPYDDDPQVIADTTVGNFRYQGPQIRAAYAVQFSPRFSAGFKFQYGLCNGAKRRYSFARILRRQVLPGMGITFRVNPTIQLGALVEWHDVKDRIELSRDVLTGEDVLVRFYRREVAYQQHVGDLTHERDWSAPRLLLSLFHRTSTGRIIQMASVSYRSPRQQLHHRTNVLNKASDWFASEWQMHYQLRWRDSRNRWRAGLRVEGEYFSSFSQHPELDILITERTRTNGLVELAAGFRGKFGQLFTQGGYALLNDRYTDYQSHWQEETKGGTWHFSLMLETNRIRSYRLIIGGRVRQQNLSGWSSYYLPDFGEWRLLLGMEKLNQTLQPGLLLEYFQRQASDSPDSYQGIRIRLFLSRFPIRE